MIKFSDKDKKKPAFHATHGKFYTCQHCKKQIQSLSYMNSHMKNYHPEIEFTPYVIPKTKGVEVADDTEV